MTKVVLPPACITILTCDWPQVEKAESVLLEIKRLLDNQKNTAPKEFVTEVKRLSDEFYVLLPHNNQHRFVIIDSRQLIANKQQLCQVLLFTNCLSA